MNIAYYVSGHGFGHLSRSLEIARELARAPRVEKIFLLTPPSPFLQQLPAKVFFYPLALEALVAQKNALEPDLAQTRKNIEIFLQQKSGLIESQLGFLRRQKADLVISDSGSLPFVLAHQLGLPSVFVGNFTWNHIFEHFGDKYLSDYAAGLAEEYRLCQQALILPYHCPVDCLPQKIYTGLVARNPTRSRAEIRQSLGFDDGLTYFLFSFGGIGLSLDLFDFSALPANYRLVGDLKSHRHVISPDAPYPDLVAACDFVISKPGYGIASECHRAGTPLLYTDRGNFAEYDCMTRALEQLQPAAWISREQLFSFDFAAALEEISRQKKNGFAALPDGLPLVAETILKLSE